MNENFKHIFDSVKNTTSLNESERVLMRNNVQAFVEEHPARAPLYIRIIDTSAMYFSTIGNSSALRFHPIASMCVLVLLIATGTSYAAENALPGDPLYGIKINFNEQVQGAFAHSDAAHANWDAQLTDKRLQEAETLAAQGRLTPTNDATIQAQLDTVTKNFEQDVAAIAQSQGSAPAVAVAQSDMEASLSAHVSVIAALSASVPDTKEPLAPILDKVRARAITISEARMLTEGTLASNDQISAQATSQVNNHPAQVKSSAAKTTMVKTASSTAATDAAISATLSASSTENVAPSESDKKFDAQLGASRHEQETKIKLDVAAKLKDQLGNLIFDATSTDSTGDNMKTGGNN